MKKYALMIVVLVMGLSMAAGVFAADKDAIKMQVDEIVMAIDGGKTAADFKDAANMKPNYVYIMEEDGTLVVHPSLEGKSLKEAAMPAYEAVMKATPEGTWVMYEWNGAEKNAYVRKTKGGEIVGSGFRKTGTGKFLSENLPTRRKEDSHEVHTPYSCDLHHKGYSEYRLTQRSVRRMQALSLWPASFFCPRHPRAFGPSRCIKLTRRSPDEGLCPLSRFSRLSRFCQLKDIIDSND
jgi:hypothetical protein